METIVPILIFLGILGYLGFTIKHFAKTKLPKWAKWKSKSIWGINFFDKNRWLKGTLIIVAQAIILFFVLLLECFHIAFQLGLKILAPKGMKKI